MGGARRGRAGAGWGVERREAMPRIRVSKGMPAAWLDNSPTAQPTPNKLPRTSRLVRGKRPACSRNVLTPTSLNCGVPFFA